MAECTPNFRAAYEAAETTPRSSGLPPTTTGFPLSDGSRSSSTETKNASMSTWKMVRCMLLSCTGDGACATQIVRLCRGSETRHAASLRGSTLLRKYSGDSNLRKTQILRRPEGLLRMTMVRRGTGSYGREDSAQRLKRSEPLVP